MPRIQGVGTNIPSAESRGELQSVLVLASQSRDSAWATNIPAHNTISPTDPTLNPAFGLPKGYTPIPTLLAKSVGNKVTLMKRPTDFPGLSSVDGQRKESLVLLPTSVMTNLNVSKAQKFPSSPQDNLQKKSAQTPQQTQVHEQPGFKMAALPKTPQAKSCQTEPKSPIQVVYKASEGLSHLVRKDSDSQVRMSVHSVVDQNATTKVMQQVVFLPSNLLIQKTETKTANVNPEQTKSIQVPGSKVTSPVCTSTDVSGFSIPESKIPVQQLDLIKDAKTGKNPIFSFIPHLQRGPLNMSECKESQTCSVQTNAPKGSMTNSSTITTHSRAAFTDSVTFTEPKQELKTVCIRDSQSILVTTRGGNTGIVKVQTSSDQNLLGSFPTSPVITISPQLKAFLVSKTATLSAYAPSQTSPSTVQAETSISMAQTQKQAPKFTHSMLTTVTSSIPLNGPEHQASTAIALSQGSSFSTAETNLLQPVHTVSSGSTFPVSTLKNVVAVPSPSISGVSPVLTQEFLSKTGVKRTSTDGRSHVTKYILVAPSSSSSSNKATPTSPPSSSKSVTSSRVILAGQPMVTSSTTFTGHLPKQVMTTGSGRTLKSSITDQTLKMGLSSAQSICSVTSEALSKTTNNTLPSGRFCVCRFVWE